MNPAIRAYLDEAAMDYATVSAKAILEEVPVLKVLCGDEWEANQ